MNDTSGKTCVIIGASHGGVNCAFALRKAGWEGSIKLYDADPHLPYHRPPLSKTYLTSDEDISKSRLKGPETYGHQDIDLELGRRIASIDRDTKQIHFEDGLLQAYDKLVLATGSRPLVPPIKGIEDAQKIFFLRNAHDAKAIRSCFVECENKRVVVIGGGYIGLEAAASMQKMGARVAVLEREDRVLARVTTPLMSDFFEQLHTSHDVDICIGKQVESIEQHEDASLVRCTDGSTYIADMIIVGVGVRVNTELAEAAGLEIENGIKVDATARTSDEDIYAIGDCTFHHNPHYDYHVRLESVQNASDQARVAAAAICGKEAVYDTIPWFWSDQYDVKLQIAGLLQGHDNVVVREETERENSFSVWYFKGEELLAVDAVNNPKAYVMGTRLIKMNAEIDKQKLADVGVAFKPAELIVGGAVS